MRGSFPCPGCRKLPPPRVAAYVKRPNRPPSFEVYRPVSPTGTPHQSPYPWRMNPLIVSSDGSFGASKTFPLATTPTDSCHMQPAGQSMPGPCSTMTIITSSPVALTGNSMQLTGPPICKSAMTLWPTTVHPASCFTPGSCAPVSGCRNCSLCPNATVSNVTRTSANTRDRRLTHATVLGITRLIEPKPSVPLLLVVPRPTPVYALAGSGATSGDKALRYSRRCPFTRI